MKKETKADRDAAAMQLYRDRMAHAKSSQPDDLPAFAAEVNAAAGSAPGKWGGDKTFVSHAWKEYRARGGRLDLAAFKARLLEASRLGLVRLSRADLVVAMNPQDVRESEIPTFGNDVFHFVNPPRKGLLERLR